ncbi:uncharacterized protein LOC115885452 [Sitophilus oryzae]|uniref:Uncharacterized protein LOC115885452 n=1 Tax=Sitophilus oryzae TaxID=7048 RepID=A0A6J2Y9S5_SITOR|nr:uncharacterized protein LOC115885452 [Sitophilus oryzae]
MHFHVLKYLLLLFLITTKCTTKLINPNQNSVSLLNQVSDFDDIFEQENSENEHSEEKASYQTSNLNHQFIPYENPSNFAGDSVFSCDQLSDSSLCPKHDIKQREPSPDSQDSKIYRVLTEEELQADENQDDQDKPQKIPLFGKLVSSKDSEVPETVLIKETQSNVKEKSEQNSKSLDSYRNTNNDCPNCKNFFPIPLLESILIGRLLESSRKENKHYPLKYIVKSVVPNFTNVQELENPSVASSFKKYLQKREQQLKRLKHHKKKKKQQKKKKKPKHPKQRIHRSINQQEKEAHINNMVEYLNKNQSFHDNYNVIPLVFGVLRPSQDRMLITGIKDNANEEDKLMLRTILNLQLDKKPENNSGNNIADVSPPANASLGLQLPAVNNETSTAKPAGPENGTALNSNVSTPEMKKNLIEVMKRQQDYPGNVASSMQVVKIEETTMMASVPQAPPVPVGAPGGPEVNLDEFPGILIYPKSYNIRKRNVNFDLVEDDNVADLNEANDLLKTIAESENMKVNELVKKDCKDSKCTDETNKILDVLENLQQESIKSEEGGFVEYSPTKKNEIDSLGHSTQAEKIQKPAETKSKLNKIEKDLKLVNEIQNIVNGVNRFKHREKKRAARSTKKKKKHVYDKVEDDEKLKTEVNGLIQIRKILRKNKNDRAFGRNRFLAKR